MLGLEQFSNAIRDILDAVVALDGQIHYIDAKGSPTVRHTHYLIAQHKEWDRIFAVRSIDQLLKITYVDAGLLKVIDGRPCITDDKGIPYVSQMEEFAVDYLANITYHHPDEKVRRELVKFFVLDVSSTIPFDLQVKEDVTAYGVVFLSTRI